MVMNKEIFLSLYLIILSDQHYIVSTTGQLMNILGFYILLRTLYQGY
jgi:hypothetical protein